MSKRLILADVDQTLLARKGGRVERNLRSAIEHTRELDLADIGVITGAPATHVPRDIAFHFAFAESGGVKILSDGTLDIFWEGQAAIEKLEEELGIRNELGMRIKDGPAKMKGADIIIEGHRFTSWTVLLGEPAHYPHCRTASTDPHWVKGCIEDAIRRRQLPLSVREGEAASYRYIDVYSISKEDRVRELLKAYQELWYLGDGYNDLEAMRLPGVKKVAFANSVHEIKQIADYYFDAPGPAGGALRFFELLLEGRL